MGACVSTHQKPSAMKVQVLFESNNNDIHLVKPSIINGDSAAKPQWATSESAAKFRDFGSKEETFFDSQAWLDSDCDDDFMSVNGEFTPSRGNKPVHHNFSTGNKNPPVSQTSPATPEKKMRLSDLFKDSQRVSYDLEDEEDNEAKNKNGPSGPNSNVQSPLVSVDGVKTKRERFGKSVQNCFPTLLSSRSSSMNGRKMMSPGPSPGPRPNVVAG